LLPLAAEAATHAYAPYSRFRVGAAVQGERGIYTGANVENASYGLSLCAERSALAAAIAAGERRFAAVAVACIDAPDDAGVSERTPCGACRQWLVELAPDAELAMLGVDGTMQVRDLLPHAFALKAKEK
jgi:cytidine deaminase